MYHKAALIPKKTALQKRNKKYTLSMSFKAIVKISIIYFIKILPDYL